MVVISEPMELRNFRGKYISCFIISAVALFLTFIAIALAVKFDGLPEIIVVAVVMAVASLVCFMLAIQFYQKGKIYRNVLVNGHSGKGIVVKNEHNDISHYVPRYRYNRNSIEWESILVEFTGDDGKKHRLTFGLKMKLEVGSEVPLLIWDQYAIPDKSGEFGLKFMV